MAHRISLTLFSCLGLLSLAVSFVPPVAVVGPTKIATVTCAPLQATAIPAELFTSNAETSSSLHSLATLDPTTILSNTLGGLLGSSAILAVPIVAALSVAALIAFFIVSYANPADEDD
eukprot:CAMPEP_0172526486 /NCGR_PEP_ID=MMETSP1067-20121228/1402_1 /TAXON_ID=265564 ORGANISM="Thalassiosira punctigera, Strain Tpunct2005C2" /NCGR_SAMPLE_ID=MMETSP1067 /ASSEMBLY_ACC=CAM_ASM_000444 /LENGTH=117 /DNA_ID=CAMNT_0013310017 /DNA_START=102 /DNA_END=455 /DNA_ORIENTATION=-